MTVPNFLSPYFRYLAIPGVTDVADIITALRDELTVQPPLDTIPGPAWTEPVADTFQSPVDDDGRYFKIALSRTSATTLVMIVTNENGNTIGATTGYQVPIDGGGTLVRLYTGPMHCFIESNRATPESIGAGLLDLVPRVQNYHTNYIYAFGWKDAFGNGFWPNIDFFGSIDNGSGANQGRAINETAVGFGAAILLDASGFTIHRPVSLVANMSGVVRRIGRLYHCYMVDASVAFGAELQIPINESPLTNGLFKVLGRATSGAGNWRLAVRKG